MLNGVADILKKQKVIYVDFTTSSKEYGQTLLKAGFIKEAKKKQFLPARLTPVENKVKIYNFEHSDSKLSYDMIDKMYISWADCDEDRLASLSLIT